MLGRYGETLVVDWGLAKSVDGPEERPADRVEQPLRPSSGSRLDPTQAGSALGTPAYMSPEQANGRLDLLGPRSDVYCLGATLYHLLTGHAPCEGDQLGEVIQNVVSGAIPRPRSVNPRIAPALEAVCLKALVLRPEDRYETAEALKADVERWLADEPVTARRDPLGARAARWARRHKSGVTAAAATLVLVAVVASVAAVLIDQSLRKERLALAAETRARGDANRRLKQARESIDTLLTGVGEGLAKIPGARRSANSSWRRPSRSTANWRARRGTTRRSATSRDRRWRVWGGFASCSATIPEPRPTSEPPMRPCPPCPRRRRLPPTRKARWPLPKSVASSRRPSGSKGSSSRPRRLTFRDRNEPLRCRDSSRRLEGPVHPGSRPRRSRRDGQSVQAE